MNTELLTLIMAKAFTLFMVLDPIGNAGPVASLLGSYETATQQRILRREVLIALLALMAFYFGGSFFLGALGISQAAVEITGGVVFMIFAISILFSKRKHHEDQGEQQEPFIVPIAIPLIAGPSCLATVILFSHESSDTIVTLLGIVVAWIGAAAVILLAPFLAKKLGRTGLRAGEQIIGIVCALIAVKMILKGVTTFMGA